MTTIDMADLLTFLVYHGGHATAPDDATVRERSILMARALELRHIIERIITDLDKAGRPA